MTSPTPHQFLLKPFLHSNLHSQFIHVSLNSSLNSHDYSYQVVFSRTWTFSCCFSVSAIVSSAFMYAWVTHELRTFPLRFCDIRLSPTIISTFLQVFVPAVMLIVTKAINLVDYREFINCNTQCYML